MIVNKVELFKNILKPSFYERDTSIVAIGLLGKILVRKYFNGRSLVILSGIITETEAYYGSDDPASHAFRGITTRSGIMFGRPGIAYVYFCYGVHYMLNAVTEKKGVPGAVLIRAVKPVIGLEQMIKNRKITGSHNIASGPGRLTQAFNIGSLENGKDLTDKNSFLNIRDSNIRIQDKKILKSCRIGISKGKEKPFRFVIQDDCLSRV